MKPIVQFDRRAHRPDAQVDRLTKIENPIAKYTYPFGMWKPAPSAISVRPIISRNDSASTFTVGWRITKSPMDFAENIMMMTETTTAVIMMEMSFAIPTAVMTESSER